MTKFATIAALVLFAAGPALAQSNSGANSGGAMSSGAMSNDQKASGSMTGSANH